MKLKIKPKEIWELKYWIHIGIIAFIVLTIVDFYTCGDILTLKNLLWAIPILGLADIISHSILNLQ